MARVAWRGNLAIEAEREDPGNDNGIFYVPTSRDLSKNLTWCILTLSTSEIIISWLILPKKG